MKHITRIGILKKSCKPNEQKTDITFTAMMVNPKTHDSFCEPTSPCFLVNNQIREAAEMWNNPLLQSTSHRVWGILAN
jgi:hypothetical protein